MLCSIGPVGMTVHGGMLDLPPVFWKLVTDVCADQVPMNNEQGVWIFFLRVFNLVSQML